MMNGTGGYQNGNNLAAVMDLLKQLLARQIQATGPVSVNVSPAGGEGKSSVELTEGAKGDIRVSIKVYSNDTTGAADALQAAVKQYQDWQIVKAGIEAARAALTPPAAPKTVPDASDAISAEDHEPKTPRKKKGGES